MSKRVPWFMVGMIVGFGFVACNGEDAGTQTVTKRVIVNRPGGFHDYQITLQYSNGHTHTISVSSDSREWKQCQLGDGYPGCAMAGG